MPSPTEKALLELSGAFAEIDDYNNLPLIYQNILKKYLHFDWLGIFTWGHAFSWGEAGGAVNISTNPHLPFNWNEIYQEIAAVDSYAEKVMSLPPGQAVILEELRPFSDTDRYVFEFCKKHSDTVHYMGMPTENGPDGRSAIGIYRTDSQKPYTEEEKQFFMTLAPFLRSSIKMMLLHQKWEMMRVSHEKIFEAEEIQPLIMDLHLNIINYPLNTRKFLRDAMSTPHSDELPEFVRTWVLETIIPQYRMSNLLGPWQIDKKSPAGDISCRAHLFSHPYHQPILVIRFRQHETAVDFQILSHGGITQREIEVLSYLPLGYTNQQIATAMDISVSGVKKHLRKLSDKLDTTGRSETLYQALHLKQQLEQQM